MPVNRNALIRYRTIDNCLRNQYRRWTLEDLIDACSDALYEYEGIDKGVSKRTVQMDIQMMRSDKLGYNAPIVVVEKKYYIYEDPEYSITNIPLTGQDLGMLSEVVEILKQFKGFSHFDEVGTIINKLEDKIHTSKTNQVSVIDFEKNENLKGLEHLNAIYHSILEESPMELSYRSFRAQKSHEFRFYPYLLKEYRNRWFVLGSRKGDGDRVSLLALDRIEEAKKVDGLYTRVEGFDPSRYFDEVIGVTVNKVKAQNVELHIDKNNAPYVLTKPLHPSQELLEEDEEGAVIRIKVKLNFELEREILGLGESVKVLKPRWLVNRIAKRIEEMGKIYE